MTKVLTFIAAFLCSSHAFAAAPVGNHADLIDKKYMYAAGRTTVIFHKLAMMENICPEKKNAIEAWFKANNHYLYSTAIYLNYMCEYILKNNGAIDHDYFVGNYTRQVILDNQKHLAQQEKEMGKQQLCQSVDSILNAFDTDNDLISNLIMMKSISKNELHKNIQIEKAFIANYQA